MNIMIAMAFKHFDEYQKKCKKTAIYPHIGRIFTPTIGLMGEQVKLQIKLKS